MTMKEQIGLALDKVTTGPDAGDFVVREIFSPELWAMIRERLIVAVLAAMREPTPAMSGAGDRDITIMGVTRTFNSDTQYIAMIDEALK
jgi:hypothetical protein